MRQDAHDWECLSPGMYESLYKCRRCQTTYMACVDSVGPYLPENGCKAALQHTGEDGETKP